MHSFVGLQWMASPSAQHPHQHPFGWSWYVLLFELAFRLFFHNVFGSMDGSVWGGAPRRAIILHVVAANETNVQCSECQQYTSVAHDHSKRLFHHRGMGLRQISTALLHV